MSLPPGLLPETSNPEIVMMICTAGHVDHGKTLLVNMLTGCQTDRLKEERERGMTIELGYAPCFLGGERCVGIVDVPGHERFVKTMVAGVSGIGFTLLVIAADDGIMPQTVEHVRIMQLLGVRQGMVALTKIDLVSPEQLAQRTGEIRAFLAGTFLAGAPVSPVSSKTFAGYAEFYDTLSSRIRGLVCERHPGIFRMPIEQVFALSGQGTVITGIPVDGAVAVGETVELVPGGQLGRIRGLERFSRAAAQGGQGQCLALNLPDFNKAPPARGQVLAAPGYLRPARCLHLHLELVPGLQKPLRNAEEVKFHAGTIEAAGKLYLLDREEVAEGPPTEEAAEDAAPAPEPAAAGEAARPRPIFATVLLNQPIGVAVGDRFILRLASPPATVAGGEILAITPGDNRPRRTAILPRLQAQLAFFAGVAPASLLGQEKRIEWWLASEHPTGAGVEAIAKGALLPPPAVRAALERLLEKKLLRRLAEDHFIQDQAYLRYRSELETRVRTAGAPGQNLSLALGELRAGLGWPAPLWNQVEADLREANLIQRSGAQIVLPGAVAQLPPADQALLERIVNVYEETGFQSPRPDELPARLSAAPERVQRLLQHLFTTRRLIRLSPLVVLSCGHLRKAQAVVVKVIRDQGVLDSADFKGHLNTSRKYALAILDHLDTLRITVRDGNHRRLAADYQKRLW